MFQTVFESLLSLFFQIIVLLYLFAPIPARIIIITGLSPKRDDLERKKRAFKWPIFIVIRGGPLRYQSMQERRGTVCDSSPNGWAIRTPNHLSLFRTNRMHRRHP